MQTNVYVDGFNLYYGALKQAPHCKWLDLEQLSQQLMLAGQTLNRIRYFTARVSGAVDPSAPARQQAYLRALRTIARLSIHEGQFKVRTVRMPDASRPTRLRSVIKTEEKGSDVNLATYVLLDACKGDSECAIVVSDDFDLKEPLRLVRTELGRKLGVVSPRGQRWLADASQSDFYRRLREAQLQVCQFPGTLTDQHGQIHRPSRW